MRRRDFIGALSGTAAAWPLVLRAQQPLAPVIGFLHSERANSYLPMISPFLESLAESGFVDGQTVAIEYRWADGRPDRLPDLAADLVRHRPSAIFTGGGAVTALAAKAATSTIPIVFVTGADPVASGLVASLNRPGGNVTGVAFLLATLAPKQFEVLNELVPKPAVLGVLSSPRMPAAAVQEKQLQASAASLGRKMEVFHANTEREVDDAFTALSRARVGGVVIAAAPFFSSRLEHLVDLAKRYEVPTVFAEREAAIVGGLASYGTSIADALRLAGTYMGRILKGEAPSNLPVQQPTRIELVINLKTAKALGMTMSPVLLARADEVIE
jgi:putative tryptophan/tyrosine transport system substrate-binding protein